MVVMVEPWSMWSCFLACLSVARFCSVLFSLLFPFLEWREREREREKLTCAWLIAISHVHWMWAKAETWTEWKRRGPSGANRISGCLSSTGRSSPRMNITQSSRCNYCGARMKWKLDSFSSAECSYTSPSATVISTRIIYIKSSVFMKSFFAIWVGIIHEPICYRYIHDITTSSACKCELAVLPTALENESWKLARPSAI